MIDRTKRNMRIDGQLLRLKQLHCRTNESYCLRMSKFTSSGYKQSLRTIFECLCSCNANMSFINCLLVECLLHISALFVGVGILSVSVSSSQTAVCCWCCIASNREVSHSKLLNDKQPSDVEPNMRRFVFIHDFLHAITMKILCMSAKMPISFMQMWHDTAFLDCMYCTSLALFIGR